MEGNFSAPFGGISIDFVHMDKIVKLHKDDMDVVVQPGMGWVELNKQLAEAGSGLFFPIDPSKSEKCENNLIKTTAEYENDRSDC